MEDSVRVADFGIAMHNYLLLCPSIEQKKYTHCCVRYQEQDPDQSEVSFLRRSSQAVEPRRTVPVGQEFAILRCCLRWLVPPAAKQWDKTDRPSLEANNSMIEVVLNVQNERGRLVRAVRAASENRRLAKPSDCRAATRCCNCEFRTASWEL